ncbi:hypothetical protein V2G26_006364 [Clonostachys chloroleuca]
MLNKILIQYLATTNIESHEAHQDKTVRLPLQSPQRDLRCCKPSKGNAFPSYSFFRRSHVALSHKRRASHRSSSLDSHSNQNDHLAWSSGVALRFLQCLGHCQLTSHTHSRCPIRAIKA